VPAALQGSNDTGAACRAAAAAATAAALILLLLLLLVPAVQALMTAEPLPKAFLRAALADLLPPLLLLLLLLPQLLSTFCSAHVVAVTSKDDGCIS
jgi:hypothetical protein